MASSTSDWSPKEDGRMGGGKAVPFKGYDETTWLIRLDWPTVNTTCRFTIREYVTGEITAERGRVWLPAPEDDGA